MADVIPQSGRSSTLLGWRIALAVLSIAIFALWYAAKISIFHSFQYTSDLISMLQMSRGYLDGKPLLFDNAFGNHRAIHNYYTLILFGPLSWFFGAYGLYFGALLVWAGAVFVTIRALPSAGFTRGLASLAWLLGPVSFWLFDDPEYGFHVEMLFVPLAVIALISLERGDKGLWLFSSFLMVATKEDGPVIACALHGFYFLSRYGVSRCGTYTVICMSWIIVFILGLALISASGTGSSQIYSGATQNLLSLFSGMPEQFQKNLQELLKFFAIMGLPFAAFFPVRSFINIIWHTVPLFVVVLIGETVKLPTVLPDILTWGPRLSPMYAFWVAIGVWGVVFGKLRTLGVKNGMALFSIVFYAAVVIAAQDFALTRVREYSIVEALGRAFEAPRATLMFKGREVAFVECVANALPRRTPLTASGYFFGPLHQHDILWEKLIYPDRGAPIAALCDRLGRGNGVTRCAGFADSQLSKGWVAVQVGDVVFASVPAFGPLAERCRTIARGKSLRKTRTP